ncbi:MAG: HNH endonuclease [Bacteroidales bacterium]
MPTRPASIKRPWVKERETAGATSKDSRYNSARWKKIRRIGLHREPYCAHCKDRDIVTEAVVRDHIKPVTQGGEFWNVENHQSLCISCHNRKTQKDKLK